MKYHIKGKYNTFRMHARTQVKGRLANLQRRFQVEVDHHVPYENIYYCCTQKTASQWFRKVFDSPIFYKNTGLLVSPYEKLGLKYASIRRAFPRKTVVTHLYISYSTYLTIPKPSSFKTFFILRDPRDAVVSWYFSAKKSHEPVGPILELRNDLQNLSLTEGLKYMIDRLIDFEYFEAQKSWIYSEQKSKEVKVLRYEDFAKSNIDFMKQLFEHLEVEMPTDEFDQLMKRNDFSVLSKGRQQGQENASSHYRKGTQGDWEKYFNQSVSSHFNIATRDLLEVLGYIS